MTPIFEVSCLVTEAGRRAAESSCSHSPDLSAPSVLAFGPRLTLSSPLSFSPALCEARSRYSPKSQCR